MSTIKISNIGPILDTGVINISPVMLIVGKQSSGKSTFMKIVCFCRWIEKHIMQNSELLQKYTHYNRFIKELKAFHRFDNAFFSDTSEIHYEGDCITLDFVGVNNNVDIKRKSTFKNNRFNTKICFIPSERNLATSIQNIDKAYKSSDYDSIFNYLLEFREAKINYTSDKAVEMPFDKSMSYFYDQSSDADKIKMKELGLTISPIFASSGVQSALPVIVMVDYVMGLAGEHPKYSPNDLANLVAKILLDKNKTINDMSSTDLKLVTNMLNYKFSQLFIEEIEENLFPESQYEMVKSIISSINRADSKTMSNSFLMMTTHSPYVLTSLNVMMKASLAYQKDKYETSKIIDNDCILPISSYSAYVMDGKGGMNDIIDHEYGFICGDYLDEISDSISDKSFAFDNIIYKDGH
jgi:ABC-type cobalamin/Fe3+-siderophores transport system ATPase subunit